MGWLAGRTSIGGNKIITDIKQSEYRSITDHPHDKNNRRNSNFKSEIKENTSFSQSNRKHKTSSLSLKKQKKRIDYNMNIWTSWRGTKCFRGLSSSSLLTTVEEPQKKFWFKKLINDTCVQKTLQAKNTGTFLSNIRRNNKDKNRNFTASRFSFKTCVRSTKLFRRDSAVLQLPEKINSLFWLKNEFFGLADIATGSQGEKTDN